MSPARRKRPVGKSTSPPSEPPPLDPFVWKACAGNRVKIPAVGSRVYYFPQGHVEQSSTPPDLSSLALNKPYILCRVAAVRYLADRETDEVFAKISLDPRIESLQGDVQVASGNGGKAAGEEDEGVSAIAKILTSSDANLGGGFSVPKFCADSIFPDLDFSNDGAPVQTLVIHDLIGNEWRFRHVYRGTPRRHLLTTGWSNFVNAKKLVAGDSVVFVKKAPSELFIGIRRRLVPANVGGAAAGGGFVRSWRGRVAAKAVVEAVRESEAGERIFEVEYYPRNRSAEFVVAEETVAAAMKVPWVAGINVKLHVETEDSIRATFHHGAVDSVVLAVDGSWPLSPWRMLKIKWEDPDFVGNFDNVSPWQVELVSAPRIESANLATRELKLLQDLINSSGKTVTGSLNPSMLSLNAFPAGLQGARQDSDNNIQPLRSQNMGGSDSGHESADADPGWSSPTSTLPYKSFLPPSTETFTDNGCSPSKRARRLSFQLFGKVIETVQPVVADEGAVKQPKSAEEVAKSDYDSTALPLVSTRLSL